MIKFTPILRGPGADIYAKITNKGNVVDSFIKKLDRLYQRRISSFLKKVSEQGVIYNDKEYELMKGTTDVINPAKKYSQSIP